MRISPVNRLYIVAGLLALGLNISSWQQPFFWDTLLTSSVVQHWLEQGPGSLILPPALDAGHPPLFYLYLWGWLSCLGKQLWVAHLAILPFTLAAVFAFLRLMKYLEFSYREQWLGLLLFFAIPAVSTQFTLVSYDAVLLALYLLAFVAYLGKRKWLFAITLIFLAGITGRGLFAITALGLTALAWHRSKTWSWLPVFVPGLFTYFAWYGYHFSQTGYIFAPDNGWSDHRGLADAGQFLHNLVAIARTQFDLGIGVLFIANVLVFLRHPRLPLRYWSWLIPFFVFSVSFVFLTNPINHRYFLVVYVLMLLPVLRALADKPVYWSVILILSVAGGHFQIYPRGISNGWDCTLAHRPYHPLKSEALAFAAEHGINRSQAGTVFPMNTSPAQDIFSADPVRMLNVNGASIDSVPYVLYSNVGNDFADDQLNALRHWRVIFTDRQGLVEMTWYENPVKIP